MFHGHKPEGLIQRSAGLSGFKGDGGNPCFPVCAEKPQKFVSAWHKYFCGFLLFSLYFSLGPDRQCGDVGPVFVYL